MDDKKGAAWRYRRIASHDPNSSLRIKGHRDDHRKNDIKRGYPSRRGVDPGLKTGCKVALVDKGGNYITHTVMQILGEDAPEKAKKLLGESLKQISIEAVAVGNGTAGRQTEIFLRKILKELGKDIPVTMVNESGASDYRRSDSSVHRLQIQSDFCGATRQGPA